MGFWNRLFGAAPPAPAAPLDATAEEKAAEVSPDLWAAFAGAYGAPTKSGVPSSTDTALQVPAFFRGVMSIANGIGQLPVEIYRPAPSGNGIEAATDHPLYDVLRYRPSELQDAFQFFTTVLMHAVAAGNSVSYKVTVNGRVRELIPVRPECVSIELTQAMRKQFHLSMENGQSVTVGPEDVFHLAGPSWRPHIGLEPAYIGREAIGLARATEESQARLHSNGVRASGLLSTESRLDKAQIEALREQFNNAYSGVANAMKTIIAGGGLKYTALSMTGVDAQHLETRKMQIEEICRVLGIFPQMVGHAGDQTPTFASAEAFFDGHIKYSLMPWVVCMRTAIETQLLTPEERRAGYFVRIDTSELTRGSLEARTRYYQAGLGTNSNPGWLTPNEVRADDGWNPLPDLDAVMSPLTMTPAGPPPPGGAPPSTASDAGTTQG